MIHQEWRVFNCIVWFQKIFIPLTEGQCYHTYAIKIDDLSDVIYGHRISDGRGRAK